MGRRCGSSKPTPTPLNDKATKPAMYVKKMKERPSLKGQEEIVKESHRRVTRDGGGRGRCMEKQKVNIKNEMNNIKEDIKNHTENPANNSGNVSCATDEWRD